MSSKGYVSQNSKDQHEGHGESNAEVGDQTPALVGGVLQRPMNQESVVVTHVCCIGTKVGYCDTFMLKRYKSRL